MSKAKKIIESIDNIKNVQNDRLLKIDYVEGLKELSDKIDFCVKVLNNSYATGVAKLGIDSQINKIDATIGGLMGKLKQMDLETYNRFIKEIE